MAWRLLLSFCVLCVLMFVACYLGTGDGPLARKAPSKKRSLAAAFVANLVVFSLVLVMVRLESGVEGFWLTFLALFVVGEGLNLFDFVVIDMLWYRHSSHVRRGDVDDPEAYRDLRPHVASFLRGIPMFALAALVAALV